MSGDVLALDVRDFVGERLGGVVGVEGVAHSHGAGGGVGPSICGGVAALEGVAEGHGVGGEAVPHVRGSVTGQPRCAWGGRVGLAVVAVGLGDVPYRNGPVHHPPAVVVGLLGAALGGIAVGVAD